MALLLKDVMPREFMEGYDKSIKFSDVEVKTEYNLHDDDTWQSWPGPQKNVMSWALLTNGYAVGWNENPSSGWSFPYISMKNK